MKFPSPLLPGDKVAMITPAGKIDRSIVDHGAELLRNQGFRVEVGSHAFDQDGIFGGSDLARSSDMQRALDDHSIKAIFFTRGGYGSIRTHPHLNWSSFFKKPKWLVGFSDITVFHAYLTNHQIASVHGVMSAWFEQEGQLTGSFLKMMEILRGKKPDYDITPHLLNRNGNATGILTGGNLSIIQSLRGTPLDLSPRGKILFIEDIDEHHYHLDRMIQNLKTGRILEKLSGLIVGYFTNISDGETPFGKTSYEIIQEAVDSYGYPVIFGLQAGHELPNYPLILGSKISMNVSNDHVLIQHL
jgi:muramoyltetrapeptide carboxypeptidase